MKKIFLKNIGIGLLLYVIYNFVLFGLAMIFGFEDNSTGPTTFSALTFAILMGVIVYAFLKLAKPKDQKEAFGYSLSWTGIVIALLLVITIANNTTGILFGNILYYLPYIAMAAAPLIRGSFVGDKN